MKRILVVAGLIVAVVIVAGVLFFFSLYSSMMEIKTVRVDRQLTVMLGGGGNSIVLTSEDGSKALVVDSKMAKAAVSLRKLVTASEIVLVNTHSHRDHAGGNQLYPTARIIAGAYDRGQWDQETGKGRYPDQTVQIGEEIEVPIGSETAVVRNMGRAHTTNDVIVYLKNRKLLVTGDIVFLGRHPVLFKKSGCSVASWTDVLDSLMARYDVNTLVPGRGPISDKSALATMHDYFVSIGEAIGDPRRQAALKEKYKSYTNIPGMASFEQTLAFIENEKQTAR